jgi:hypothetical protein
MSNRSITTKSWDRFLGGVGGHLDTQAVLGVIVSKIARRAGVTVGRSIGKPVRLPTKWDECLARAGAGAVDLTVNAFRQV